MFENLKLKLYKDKIVGMAYSVEPYELGINKLITYLVINENDAYSFIKYKSGTVHLSDIAEQTQHLETIGYKSLVDYAETNEKNKTFTLNKNITK